jgi:hypothetical protein
MTRRNRPGRRFRGFAGLGWVLCLVAAVMQAAMPVVHAGHAHGDHGPHEAGLANETPGCHGDHGCTADGPEAAALPVLEIGAGAGGHSDCGLCRLIGMTRNAVVLDGSGVPAVVAVAGAACVRPRDVVLEAVWVADAPPRGPPACLRAALRSR